MKLLAMLSVLLLASTAAGEIPANPNHSLLWNKYTAVTALNNNVILAGSNDGLAVLRYTADFNSVVTGKQIFLDDGVQSFKSYGQYVVARTQNHLLYVVDVRNPMLPIIAGRIDLGFPFSDFALKDSSLYVCREFKGLWQYRLSDFKSPKFVDSSMLGIHYVQVEVAGDTLYALDDYNGVLRYTLSGSGGMTFDDYLYVPLQVKQFCVLGGRLALRTGEAQLLLAHFEPVPEIYRTVSLLDPPTALLPTATTVLAYTASTKVAELVIPEGGLVWRQVIADRLDPLLRGTIVLHDTGWESHHSLVIPAEVGLREYDLELIYLDPAGKQLLTRPGPITSLALGEHRLYTAGLNNPLDLYSVTLDGVPTYSATLYPEFTRVSDLQLEPESLFVQFDQIERTVILEPSADSFIYAGAIATKDIAPTDIIYRSRKLDTVRPFLAYQEQAVGLFGLTDSGIPVKGPLLGAPARITQIGMIDSLLLMGTTKGIWIYRIYNNLNIEFRSKITAVVDCPEMRELNGRMLIFDNNRMLVVNLSDPRTPIVDTSIEMPSTAYASALDGDYMYTVGPQGLCRFDITGEFPTLVDYGGRAGTIIAASDGIVATSDGGSLHLYDLRGVPTDVDEPGAALPSSFALEQNYPNPFNPNTTISYELPRAAHVELVIYNLLGQRVTTLVDESQRAGRHSVEWSGRSATGEDLASGIYFYRLRSGELSMSRKMVLLK